MKFITDYFKNKNLNKIKKKISKLQEQAVQWQRNGNLREYAFVTKEIDDLVKSLEEQDVNKEKLSYTPPERDFVDYDGMGNQGRFPAGKK